MSPALIHEVLPVGMLQCNCSILGDPDTREAVVLDPGDEVDRILAVLAKHRLKVIAIVSTHTHIDHVGGLAKLHDVTGAPVFMHRDDLDLYRHLDLQAQWLGVPTPETTGVESFLRDGDTVRWGGYEARVLHTPGHTPGSISLYMPDEAASNAAPHPAHAPRLFAGDTLFAGSIGRTDLWGGSMKEIMKSLRGKLLALPNETIVFPGHGPTTTIGAERETNPFLRT
jgi:glyoxylase-like metal-dependent hydrolase (beta-lactamase superfamily II)